MCENFDLKLLFIYYYMTAPLVYLYFQGKALYVLGDTQEVDRVAKWFYLISVIGGVAFLIAFKKA